MTMNTSRHLNMTTAAKKYIELSSWISLIRRISVVLMACVLSFGVSAHTQEDSDYIIPDLSTVWESDFGPIYWLGGYYGEPSKVLKGELNKGEQNQSAGKYIFKGKWGRVVDARKGIINLGEPEKQWVEFKFSKDGKSFKGTYLSSNGKTEATWNGKYKAGSAYSLGETQKAGGQYNGVLAHQIEASNSDAAQNFENYDQNIAATARCTTEVIDFFKKQGLSNPSIVKLCR